MFDEDSALMYCINTVGIAVQFDVDSLSDGTFAHILAATGDADRLRSSHEMEAAVNLPARLQICTPSSLHGTVQGREGQREREERKKEIYNNH